MKFSQEKEEGALVFRLEGQLMAGPEAEALRSAILSGVEQGTRTVLLDMEGVSWVNSSGLGILISGHLAARRTGSSLKLMKISSRIESILNVTRLSSILEVYPTEEEARRSLEASPAEPR